MILGLPELVEAPPAPPAPPAAVGCWSDVCLTCDYPLTGLPDSGICPECGEKYDACAIAINGLVCSRAVAILSPVVISGGILWYLWWLVSMPRLPGEAFMVAVLAYAVLQIIETFEGRYSGRAQIQLDDYGAIQFYNLNPSVERTALLRFLRLVIGLSMLPYAFVRPWQNGEFFYAFNGLYFSVIEIRKLLSLRRKIADFRRSGSKNLKRLFAAPIPWNELRLLGFKRGKDDLYRLRLDRFVGRSQMPAVRIYLRLTPQHASYLRWKVDQWLTRN